MTLLFESTDKEKRGLRHDEAIEEIQRLYPSGCMLSLSISCCGKSQQHWIHLALLCLFLFYSQFLTPEWEYHPDDFAISVSINGMSVWEELIIPGLFKAILVGMYSVCGGIIITWPTAHCFGAIAAAFLMNVTRKLLFKSIHKMF